MAYPNKLEPWTTTVNVQKGHPTSPPLEKPVACSTYVFFGCSAHKKCSFWGWEVKETLLGLKEQINEYVKSHGLDDIASFLIQCAYSMKFLILENHTSMLFYSVMLDHIC